MRVLSRQVPLGAALLLIVFATLVPMGPLPPRFYWRLEPSDVLVNLCLYLPLGLLLARAEVSPRMVGLLALLLSGSIELLQGTLITGRRGSLADVLANLGGALLGAALYHAILALRRSPWRGWLPLGAIFAALPPLGWLASGPLLLPAPAYTPSWYGQWAHHFIGTEVFRGSILSVAFQGHPVPDDAIASTRALQAETRGGALTLDVTLRSAGPTEGLTHLASVADGTGSVVISLEQSGSDLLVSWRSRGAALGLRAPRVVLPGLLEAEAGEQIAIQAVVTGARVSATVGTTGAGLRETRRLTALTGWRSLIPTRELSSRAQRLFDLVWSLGLAGYLLVAVRVLRSFRLSY